MNDIKKFKERFENRVLLRILKEFQKLREGSVPQQTLIAYIVINWKRNWLLEEKKYKKEKFLDDWFGKLDLREECRDYWCDKPMAEKSIKNRLGILNDMGKMECKQTAKAKLWRIFL